MCGNRLGFVLFLLVVSVPSIVVAGEIYGDVPRKVNPEQKYLFYMHGIAVELYGPDSYSDKFDKIYAYTDIVKAFAARGFNVISEVRPKGTLPVKYSQKVADQIRALIKAGVSANHIAVVGFSKGGFTTLWTSSFAFQAKVHYVILSGCALPDTHDVAGVDPRKVYEKFLSGQSEMMNGRFLSVYDKSDEWFGSCSSVFSVDDELETKEIVLQTGEGHSLFYEPDPRWLDVVLAWINEGVGRKNEAE